MKIRNISIYFIFNAVSALIPIVTLPLFTRYMSTEDYGLWAAFSLITMYLSTVSRWEINSALKFHFVTNKDNFGIHCSSAFIFGCYQLVLYTLIWGVVLLWGGEWFGIPASWISAVMLIAFFRYNLVNLHHLLQIDNRALLYGVWSLFSNLSLYGLAVLILIYCKNGWQARVLSELLVSFISFVIAIFYFRKYYDLNFSFNKKIILQMLLLSGPLLFSELMGILLITGDRLFIATYLDNEILGLYAVAMQLASSINLCMSSIYPVWEASVFRRNGVLNNHIRKKLKLFFGMVFLSLPLLIILPYLLDILLPFLVDKKFATSNLYLLPAMLIVLMAGFFSMLKPITILLKKTKIYAITTLILLPTSYLAMLVGLQTWGSRGVAYGLSFTYGVGVLVILLYIYNLISNDKSYFSEVE